jgi:signal transduction histidine kinase
MLFARFMSTFAELLRELREDLVDDWRSHASGLATVESGETPALLPEASRWLDAIAAACERSARDQLAVGDLLDADGGPDVERGGQLGRAVRELAVLRDRLGRRFARDSRELHAAVDAAMVTVVSNHAHACERVIHAFDAIAATTLSAADVDDLVQRLLQILVTHVDAFERAELFAVEAGDRLARRAVAGSETPADFEAMARVVAAAKSVRHDADLLGVPLVERGELVGITIVRLRNSHPLHALGRRVLQGVSAGMAAALFDERARRAAELGAARQRFLGDASRALATSLDIRETLEHLARLAVPALADWCVVDLVEDNAPRRITIAHADPGKLALARVWAEKYPLDEHSDSAIARVIRTGEPVYVRELTDEMLVAAIRDPERLQDTRALDLRSLIVAPLVARGHVLGAITLALSGTLRRYGDVDRELALELGRRAGLAVDNSLLYDASQQAVRLREEILAVVSHDLRNPLSAINLSASNLLELWGDDPKPRKSLEIIRRAGDRMERLIRDLLDLARIQSGTLHLELQVEDLQTIVDEVMDAHEALARERDIALVRGDHDHITLTCDRARIMQVLSNLVGNALKFCRAGDRVSVTTRALGGEAAIEVEDNGPGIAEDELPRIFQPYFSGALKAKQGTGLGLYISRGIILAHRGTLTCDSAPGRGARFSIRVPRSE